MHDLGGYVGASAGETGFTGMTYVPLGQAVGGVSYPSVLVVGPEHGGDTSRFIVGSPSLSFRDAVRVCGYFGYGEASVGLLEGESNMVAELVRRRHVGDGPTVQGVVSTGVCIGGYSRDCLDVECYVEIGPCCKRFVPRVQVVDDVFGRCSKVVLTDDGSGLA